MELFAKEKEMSIRLPVFEKEYELFVIETIKDVNGNDVQIPKSTGSYTLSQLQQHKEMLLNQIKEIDDKIVSISALENFIQKQ